jgi:nicotinate phosphoribosyltransferase
MSETRIDLPEGLNLSEESLGIRKFPIAESKKGADKKLYLCSADINLPTEISFYTDKYFSRTLKILQESNLNPTIRAQVFIRKGPGEVSGITEALHLINEKSSFFKNGGKAWALEDGDKYESKDTVIVLEGKLQDIVEFETIYLGIISRATTARNDSVANVDLASVTQKMKAVVDASEGRPVIYFGARHWHWEEDSAIAEAAFNGGAIGASTDAAASVISKSGVGTIPHVLENAFAYKCGKENAVVESTVAFDKIIDKSVPRIALIDYNNKEIDDSLAVANKLKDKLWGVRVDTCGENVMQSAVASFDPSDTKEWIQSGKPLISQNHPHSKNWVGTGVTITGVYALRKALDEAGFSDVKLVLTSGFGNAEKVKAFVYAEKLLGVKLFDQLGVGELYHTRSSTMDVVSVKDSDGEWVPLSKVGRGYRPNSNLKEVVIK